MNERYYLVFSFSRDAGRITFLVIDDRGEIEIDPMPSVVSYMAESMGLIYPLVGSCEIGPELVERLQTLQLVHYTITDVEPSYELEPHF